MLSYFGSKWRAAKKHYPAPEHNTIIEPFAGGAGYALNYHEKDVILCEIDPIVFGVWDYLIKSRPEEILELPLLEPTQSVDDLNIHQEARWLIGFWVNSAVPYPRKTPSKWMRDMMASDRPYSGYWGRRQRERIAWQSGQIKHWQAKNCSYADLQHAGEATWYVDPPYQEMGKHYRFGSSQMDYESLAEWCKSREGQVIVCENEGATWLPFGPLASLATARHGRRSEEVIWTNTPANDNAPKGSQAKLPTPANDNSP